MKMVRCSYRLCNYIITCSHTVPEAPTNFLSSATTSTTIRLSWSTPNVTNGIILGYTIVYSNNIDTFLMTYNDNTFEDTINNLNKYTQYRFVIYANTSAGEGDNATTTVRTLEDG